MTTLTEMAGRRIRQLRQEQRISAATLATQCQVAGAKGINRDTIANLETGRRERLSIDELAVIALALNVSPIHLLSDPDDPDDVAVTDTYSVRPFRLRAWLASRMPLQRQDDRAFQAAAVAFLDGLPEVEEAVRDLARRRQPALRPLDDAEIDRLEAQRAQEIEDFLADDGHEYADEDGE